MTETLTSTEEGIIQFSGEFVTELGGTIHDLQAAFWTYGKLNQEKNNVVWVFHAFSANADVQDWWPGMFGENGLLDKGYFVVCVNMLGSCYGTTGPLSINPKTEAAYGLNFPSITIRDMVKVNQMVAERLGIHEILMVMGGSMGGQQALEWAIMEPDRIKNMTILAANAKHSPWGIAFNEAQRMALNADLTFTKNQPNGGIEGMKAARAMALLSYRHYDAYSLKQAEENNEVVDNFKAISYQHHQGEKLAKRFSPYSYWFLSKAMDSHNIGRNRKSITDVLKSVKAKSLVIGIESDLLFPLSEQELLAEHIPSAKLQKIDSPYGHDGFLIEYEAIQHSILQYLL